MDLDRLRLFYVIAKSGSISRAASVLNMTQPSLSRQLGILEHTLKTKLFIRHARGIILTRKGEVWFKYVKNAMAELEAAKIDTSDDEKVIQGTLKIAATYGFASTVLFDHIINFAELYPDVDLILNCNDKNLDLNAREADVAIGWEEIYDPNLIHTYLTTRELNIYASSKYLEKFGEPKTPEELDGHKLIIFATAEQNFPYPITSWLLKIGRPHGSIRKPYMVVNSVECMVQAAKRGLGIVGLSHDSCLLKDSNLNRILPDVTPPKLKVHYIYPKSLQHVKAVRALESYLLEQFSSSKEQDQLMANAKYG